MSEAAQNPPHRNPHPGRVTQLRFKTDIQLAEHMKRLYAPEIRNTPTGLQSLFLYSDEAIRVERPQPRDLTYGAPSRTPAQVAEMQRVVSHRQHMLRPLAKRLQLSRYEGEGKGTVLHLDVILDGLTAAAVRGIMVVQPDNSIQTHHLIPQQQLTDKAAFMEACRALYERLADENRPLQISSVDVIENEVAK